MLRHFIHLGNGHVDLLDEKYLEENAGAAEVALTPAETQQLQELLAARPVAGARYGEGALRLVNR